MKTEVLIPSVLLAFTIIAEILTPYIGVLWGQRKHIYICLAFLIALSSAMLISIRPNIFTLSISAIALYRFINDLRVVSARINVLHLQTVVKRSSIVMGLLTVVVVLVWMAHLSYSANIRSVLFVNFFLGAQLLIAFGILLSTLLSVNRYKAKVSTKNYADRDLPSLSVCIPARNETDELSECLKLILASNYSKLEILVLDDCSQTKTSEIIKSFAQKGVRFVKGKEPQQNWLAKNQAYGELAKQASGEYLFFCGVDLKIESETLRNLMIYMTENETDMVGLLPNFERNSLKQSFLQPLRYWWELAIPRFILHQPAVLSTAWVINKSAFKKVGGMDAVSRTIRPEKYFARELNKRKSYQFLMPSTAIAMSTSKPFKEQMDTALRNRYPELHKRPETVISLSLFELLFIIAPFVLLPVSFLFFSSFQTLLVITVCLLLVVTHLVIAHITTGKVSWIDIVNLPMIIVAELLISNESMRRYEFSVVDWKGRNVCIPIMHVIPSLPKV